MFEIAGLIPPAASSVVLEQNRKDIRTEESTSIGTSLERLDEYMGIELLSLNQRIRWLENSMLRLRGEREPVLS